MQVSYNKLKEELIFISDQVDEEEIISQIRSAFLNGGAEGVILKVDHIRGVITLAVSMKNAI
jgi:hypothetical protein